MRWALDALDGRGTGELMLAACLTPSIAVIPPLLRQFSDRSPRVSVKLRTLPSEAVVHEVAQGRAAIGIAGEIGSAEAVERTPILIDELVGIAPTGLVNSEGGWMSRGQFARNNLMLGADGSSTRRLTERSLARAEFRPSQVWTFDSYETIKWAVGDGLGVSFMSRLLVRDVTERGAGIVPPCGDEADGTADLCCAVEPRRGLPQVAAFMSLLIDERGAPSGVWQHLRADVVPKHVVS